MNQLVTKVKIIMALETINHVQYKKRCRFHFNESAFKMYIITQIECLYLLIFLYANTNDLDAAASISTCKTRLENMCISFSSTAIFM